MKRIFKLSALAALAIAALSCEKPNEETPVGEALTANPKTIEATHEGKTEAVTVKANCEYTVVVDEAAAGWLTAAQDGNTVNVTVAANEGEARTAKISFNSKKSGKLLASVAVSQTAKPSDQEPENPNPDDPTPGEPGELLALEFDFNHGEGKGNTFVLSGPVADWPITNRDTEVEKTYTIDGTAYKFILSPKTRLMRSSDGTTTLVRIDDRTSDETAASTPTNQYLGLPAVTGKKLVKAVILGFPGNERPTVITDGEWNSVSESIPMNGVNEYTFNINNPEVDKVYYVSSKDLTPTKQKFLGFTKITLYYGDANHQGTPVDPEKPDTPVDPEKPDTPVEPEKPDTPAKELTLDFNFGIAPLEGWPTENALVGVTNVEGGKDCVYPLDGVNYTFNLADCIGASKGSIFWAPGDAPCFKIGAEKRYLGLPAIEGKKLVKVEVYTIPNGSASKTPNFIIMSGPVPDVSVASADYPVVEGGEKQSPAKKGEEPKVLTYNLKGTEAGVVYRFTSCGGGVYMTRLVLTYTE